MEIKSEEFSQMTQLLSVKRKIFPEEINKPEYKFSAEVNKESHYLFSLWNVLKGRCD